MHVWREDRTEKDRVTKNEKRGRGRENENRYGAHAQYNEVREESRQDNIITGEEVKQERVQREKERFTADGKHMRSHESVTCRWHHPDHVMREREMD